MKGKHYGLVALTGTLLLLSLVVAGCGTKNNAGPAPQSTLPPRASAEQVEKDEWQQVLNAAAAEGKLVVNMPNGEFVRQVMAAFEADHPEIHLEFTQLQGRDFTPRVGSERNAGQYLWDVYVGGGSTLYGELMPLGALVEFPRDLPETKPGDELDRVWRDGFDYGYIDNEKKYGLSFSSFKQASVLINRDVIPREELSTPDDLLNAKWKGKIAWQEPHAPGAGSLAAAQLLYSQGEDYLRALFGQEIVITDNRRQLAEWVFRGAYPIGLGVAQDDYDLLKSELNVNVEPIDIPDFVREAFGSSSIALFDKAPHPNAGKVFINWLLSQKGQTKFAEESKLNSRRLDVPIVDEATHIDAGQSLLSTNKQENADLVAKARKIVEEEIK